MGYKMKGCKYSSPLNQYKKPSIPMVNYDEDDQSKENAKKKGNICSKCGKLKGNCSCKGAKHKVHRDGNKNQAVYKGKPIKGNWQPHQFKN
jgi:hypothetical protein